MRHCGSESQSSSSSAFTPTIRLTKIFITAVLSVWFMWLCHDYTTRVADHSLRVGFAEGAPSSGHSPAIAFGPNDFFEAIRLDGNFEHADLSSSLSLLSYCFIFFINFQRLLTLVYCFYLLSLPTYRLGFLVLRLRRYMTKWHD